MRYVKRAFAADLDETLLFITWGSRPGCWVGGDGPGTGWGGKKSAYTWDFKPQHSVQWSLLATVINQYTFVLLEHHGRKQQSHPGLQPSEAESRILQRGRGFTPKNSPWVFKLLLPWNKMKLVHEIAISHWKNTSALKLYSVCSSTELTKLHDLMLFMMC